MKIRIIIADDHAIVRNGLRSLIEHELDMEVIAEADNGRDAVRTALKLAPDVMIMDIAMPDLNGIDATRQIITALPRIKIIALSMHADKRYVMEMLKAGASGYILKDNAYEELARAIRTALKNHTYLSPQVTETVIGDYVQLALAANGSAFSLLSLREREVLQLLAEGNSTAQIGDRLFISEKTVETYRQNIREKLDIRSIAELTKYAIREGLTSL
ncbi:MAG: response regulator transcription factor [Desulfuromonadales bacterium]|nr:response regulator transcription factor [Desulfuromonadales bacterium]